MDATRYRGAPDLLFIADISRLGIVIIFPVVALYR
jgi:hypothetical protein